MVLSIIAYILRYFPDNMIEDQFFVAVLFLSEKEDDYEVFGKTLSELCFISFYVRISVPS